MAASTTASMGGSFDPNRDINFGGAVDFATVPTQGSAAVVTTTATQTLSGKTLTSPVINGAVGKRKVTTYADSGAIAVESHVAYLTKSTASAMTIAAPTSGTDDGIEITIVAGTAAAHVLTLANKFQAGETGGPFDKVTTAAFIGSAATILALAGVWHVISDQIATVGD